MIKRAEKAGTDFIEIRLDYLSLDVITHLDELKEIVNVATVPLIATNRQFSQGGYRAQEEIDRVQVLMTAAKIGFQYIDIELTTVNIKSTVQKIKEYGSDLIISFHDFNGTPDGFQMEKYVKAEIETEAKVCKLITTANSIEDNIKCMLLTHKMSRDINIVCFAMGSKGGLSRILSPFFGGFFTFASLESSLKTASGQMSITDLKEFYKKMGVDK
jgi:3-dehydroquinate dehydratase type I